MAINILAIVQVRMGSVRFPGKSLKKINGRTLIEVLLHRLSKSIKIDKIILASPNTNENDVIERHANSLGYKIYRGSEHDVLDRYYNASNIYKPKIIVRITGDCPIIDPEIIDEVITLYEKNDADYVSNTIPASFPDGLDVEVFSYSALERAHLQAEKSYDREHVTSFIYSNNDFKCINYVNEVDYSRERWTVDHAEDFEVLKNIIKYFEPNLSFSWLDVIELKNSNPEYFDANKHFNRNEGHKEQAGQKLWKRAKRIIPTGNMMLTKNSELFLPNKWPSYFSEAKGCSITDLDGNEYIDMSYMGVGVSVLGYGHQEVDEAVMDIVKCGNMTTLNCPEEVYLAEKLVEMHPWSDMVRFARTGGEANAMAIRIARAAIGKEKVAICGYHGWHDWYLAANLDNDKNLDGHLLPGLEPKGVPSKLKNTILTFNYNDFDSLEKLVKNNDVGVIKMEVSRSIDPAPGFLESVRALASKNNIILIFDECTSGFRETFGGLHKKYNINPDMMVLGKTLGNGYAITAVVGKKKFMKAAQETFISSTFWTERIGPTAALKALEVMEREKSWEQITHKGNLICTNWKSLAEKFKLPINIFGLPSIANFNIPVENWIKYKTLITQEMLKKGYLATNSVYACTEHTDKIIKGFFDELEPVFSLIADCENGKSVDDLLEGPVCSTGFKRMN